MVSELRILILEDKPTDAELMERELRKAGIAFVSQRVDTKDAFIQALEEFRPDVVLADYKRPNSGGLTALKIVRRMHPEVPVIIVTGMLGEEPAIELLKAGAKDYVLKSNLAQLAPAVQRALSEEQGIRARKAAEKAVRQAEQALQKVNRTLRALSECNALLIHTEKEQDMFNDVCRMLVATGCYRMAWVGLAEHDAGKIVRPLAHRGYEAGYLKNARISWADGEQGQSLAGTAIRTGAVQIAQDLVTDSRMAPWWRHEVSKRGYASGIAVPLKNESGVFGVLAIFASQTNAFTDEEVGLLEELAADLAFGIDALRNRVKLKRRQEHLEELVQSRTTELRETNQRLEKEVEKRRRARERLLRTAQRLEYLVASSPTVIYSRKVDGDCPATFVSANVENLMGYEPRDFTEDPGFWPSHINPEDAPRVLEGLGHLAEKGQDSRDYRFRLKDGSYRWLHDELKLTYDANGRPLEAVGYLSDITARKEVERLKDELISTVSHELRTPLTTLRGFVELLLARDFPPEKERQFLGIVDQETMRLTRLIDDFLDIQRIESGRQEYRFESLDVLALLRDMAELFQKSDHKHTIRVDAPAGLPLVQMDGERIRQVLENLISNALKFSPAGGEILLRAGAEGNEIEISVTDPGIGIPAEEIPRIFQKFYRVERPGMPRFPGTGLGLAMVREIVQKHGGRVWAESEPGRGSTFHFTLPVEEKR
jgi:PAS domain S-box-containing protein